MRGHGAGGGGGSGGGGRPCGAPLPGRGVARARSDRFERRDEISKALDDVVGRLRAAGLWCAPVNDLDAAFADPAVEYLDPTLEIDHPVAGKVRVLKHPIHYGAGAPELRQVPPGVGEHTEEVLVELGYAPEAVADLRARGAI